VGKMGKLKDTELHNYIDNFAEFYNIGNYVL